MRPAAWSLLLLLLLLLLLCCSSCHALTPEVFQRYGLPVSAAVLREYGHFPAKWRSDMRDTVKEMFYFGYDNYLQHAYPLDELNPVDCSGRGPDWNDVSNINVNDVLGNYSLTLVDSLDALLVRESTCLPSEWLIDWLLIDDLIDWLIDWWFDWLMIRLIDWLIDWMILFFSIFTLGLR